MSKLSAEHFRLRRLMYCLMLDEARARSINPDDVDFKGHAEHYEKKDGYRTIDVGHKDNEFLKALAEKFTEDARERDIQMGIYVRLNAHMRDGHSLHVSIWPHHTPTVDFKDR